MQGKYEPHMWGCNDTGALPSRDTPVFWLSCANQSQVVMRKKSRDPDAQQASNLYGDVRGGFLSKVASVK